MQALIVGSVALASHLHVKRNCNGRIVEPTLSTVEALLMSASQKHWGDNDSWGLFVGSDGETYDIENLGQVTVVEQHGGYEDAGSYTHLIFKIVDGDSVKFYKKVGFYDSWDGTRWDGPFTEVRCETKTITAYMDVQS